MTQLIFPKVFLGGDHLKANDLNAFLNAIANVVNGNLGNSNFSSSPTERIAEGKIKFNTQTGHTHNGVDSKRVILPPMVVGVSGYVYNGLNSPALLMNEQRTINQIRVVAGTAGDSDTVVSLDTRISGESEWESLTTVTLSAGALIAGGTFNKVLNVNDCIRMRVVSTSGAVPQDITVELWQNLS